MKLSWLAHVNYVHISLSYGLSLTHLFSELNKKKKTHLFESSIVFTLCTHFRNYAHAQ